MARGRRVNRGRDYRLGLTEEADAQLRALRTANKTAHQVVSRFIDALRDDPYIGVDLHGEWDGSRAAHVYDDRYRVIWSVDRDLGYIAVQRVGRRLVRGVSVYDEPREDQP